MSKHTPGPWEIIEDDYGDEHWFGGFGGGQIQVNEWVNGGCLDNPKEWAKLQAEARLIAASPDLYAVLKELQESAQYWSEYDVPLGIVDRINQAIAKAEGNA